MKIVSLSILTNLAKAFTISILLLSINTFAADDKKIEPSKIDTASTKEIRVGWFLTAPFRLGDLENPDGLDFDILNFVAKKLGYSLKFIPATIPRFLKLAENNDVDILSFLIVTPEREEFLSYLKPSYFDKTVRTVYVKKGTGKLYRTMEDIEKMESVGVKLGAKYFSEFDSNEKINKISNSGVDQHFNMLIEGRITGVMAVETEAEYFIKKLNLENKIEKSLFTTTDTSGKCCYFAISKKSPLLSKKEEIEKIIYELKSSGQIEKWTKKYVSLQRSKK